MLSYALAIAVAISSLILFSTAFLMSKIHRKDDFLWSAVGLFYALILWFCARNITGTVLLGQAAATVLIISYCWQTIKLRRIIANPDLAAETSSFSVVSKINGLFKRKSKLESPAAPVVKPPAPKVTEQEITIPETPVTPAQTSETPVASVEELQSDYAPPTLQDRQSDLQPQAIKPTQEQYTSKVIEPQPLPNKLPYPVAQPYTEDTEAETQTEKPAVRSIQMDNSATEAVQAVNSNPQTAADIKKIDNALKPQTEPKPEVITPEVEAESFDSLEVVEVAEVLEAEIDNVGERREFERDNIIEVTTTEINVVTETQKIDRNQADDSDLQEN